MWQGMKGGGVGGKRGDKHIQGLIVVAVTFVHKPGH